MYRIIKHPVTNQEWYIKRLFDGVEIPINEDNEDYQEYKQWIKMGFIPRVEIAKDVPYYNEDRTLDYSKAAKEQNI